jgi:hypothetical protein
VVIADLCVGKVIDALAVVASRTHAHTLLHARCRHLRVGAGDGVLTSDLVIDAVDGGGAALVVGARVVLQLERFRVFVVAAGRIVAAGAGARAPGRVRAHEGRGRYGRVLGVGAHVAVARLGLVVDADAGRGRAARLHARREGRVAVWYLLEVGGAVALLAGDDEILSRRVRGSVRSGHRQ